jgi:hypothetical protein
VDKIYICIWIPTIVLIAAAVILACFEPPALIIMIPTLLFVVYFFVSPLFGYVELREETVFIKFGFILTREVAYSKIRSVTKERKFYSDSMLSLKNAMEHVNIKYNTFDILSVSVVGNDDLIKEIKDKCNC